MYGNKKIRAFVRKLKAVQEKNECVIIMSNESGLDTTKAVYIDYVGERWAKGHSVVYVGQEKTEIPETINYADIITVGSALSMEVLFPTDIENEVR